MRKYLILVILMSMQHWLSAQVPMEVQMYDKDGKYFSASSELKGIYSVYNLFDNSGETAWVEGKDGSGVGEYVFVSIDQFKSELSIINGYAKSENLFRANNRIQKLKVSLYAGFHREGMVTELFSLFELFSLKQDAEIILKDEMEKQSIALPFYWEMVEDYAGELKSENYKNAEGIQLHYFVKLEIVSVYKGTKYDDTCISELTSKTEDEYPLDLRLTSDECGVLLKKGMYMEDTLVYNPEFVFQIVDLSKLRDWVVLIKMPAMVGDGRAETEYVLYNTLNKKTSKELYPNMNIGTMYGFTYKDGKTYLEYEDAGTVEVKGLQLN